MGAFKEPHGGELKELYLDESSAEEEKQKARDYASWDLTARQLCDIELLLNGAFSPLDGFLTEADYDGVVTGMRLTSGVLWPMPITLDVTAEFAAQLEAVDLDELGLDPDLVAECAVRRESVVARTLPLLAVEERLAHDQRLGLGFHRKPALVHSDGRAEGRLRRVCRRSRRSARVCVG